MIDLKGRYYVEVKDQLYSINPFYDITLRERKEEDAFRTQFEVQDEIKIKKNQNVK